MSLQLPAKLRSSLLVLLSLLAFTAPAKADEAVVLVQLNEYNGPEAYFHLYLVNPEGKFDRTLWVSGPDKIWWPDSKRWFGYHPAPARMSMASPVHPQQAAHVQ
ncbi:DUF2271 domain-containing protein [Aliamphritea spongicola]|nr:DUF2271 domain-containing protein [Aliamphritea spongicola]